MPTKSLKRTLTSTLGIALAGACLAITPASASHQPLGDVELRLGQPITDGHWETAACQSVDGQPVAVPAIAIMHRSHFQLAKPSRVKLTLRTDSNSPSSTPHNLSIGRINATAANNPTTILDRQGKPAELSVAGSTGRTVDHLTIDLPAGRYGTSGFYGYCQGRFTVSLDSVSPLRLTNQPARWTVKQLNLQVGQQQALAELLLRKTKTTKLTWRSSNPLVATVTKHGRLRAHTAGQTTISVRIGKGKAVKLELTVRPA